MNFEIYTKIYDNTVIPVMDYVSGIWGIKRYDSFERLQYRAISTFLGISKCAPIPAVLGDMGWLPVYIHTQCNAIPLWCRLMKMPDNRLCRKVFCWDIDTSTRYKNTWFNNMKTVLNTCNLTHLINYSGDNISTNYVLETVKSKCVDDFKDRWINEVCTMPKLRTMRTKKYNEMHGSFFELTEIADDASENETSCHKVRIMSHTGESLETKRETENFTRINRLLQRVATPVVKVQFDSEFHPTQLKSTLAKWRIELRKQKSINQYQFTLLYPVNGEPSSSDFDLTLLICLLRHLDTKVPISDILPVATDASVAASLSRLKYYRNQVAHSQTLTLSCAEFEIWWNDITNAICVLGGECFKEKCKQLKYCPLDGRDLPLEIKKIVNSVREPEKEEYLYWIEEVERYFPIPAVIDDITEAFKQHHFIVISGHAGTGKTALARYVALNLHKKQDMSIFPVNNPNTIQHQLALRYQINSAAHKLKVKKMPVSGKKKQTKQAKPIKVIALDTHTNQSILMFVVDDFLGRYTINKRLSNAWKELYYEHFYIPSNEINSIYILATCREEIRGTYNVNFFEDPYSAFEKEFEEIRCRSEPCYIGLALLTIYDGKLSKPLSDQISVELVSKLCEECQLPKSMKLYQIQQELEIVVGRYVIDEVTANSLVHPEFYEILLHYFIKKIPESLIAFGSHDFLQNRVQLEGSTNGSSNFVSIVIEKNHAEIYFDRLIEEIKLNQFENAFQNMQVANAAYQEQLIQHIQKSDEVSQIYEILAASCLPLILSVENNSSELVRLILEKREEFNMSREVEIERKDDFDVIDYEDRKLLNLQSSINDEEILLMLACLCGSARVVGLLLALGYDINYQNSMQKAPIHLACLRGNDEVVQVLLGIQSTGKEDSYRQISLETDCDIDIQDANGLTALHMACRTGHTKVVNLLLKKWKCSLGDTEEQSRIAFFADKFNVTDNQRRLALHLAAGSSSADVFKILFQAISLSDCTGPGQHADANHDKTHLCNMINTQDKEGKTFLFTACENGNTNCVEFLMKYGCCNINIWNNRNETPVFRACQYDNTEIVDILVKYKADVNIKDITGRTPLHVSVENKNENMVNSILKNKNCNVNARDRADYTALYLAVCRKNFKIVETLLKADCNPKCDLDLIHSNQKTPLLAAISTGSAKIVEILIASGCDLSKYDSEGRKAFHIACEINYDGDIIALFIKHKKDFDINDSDYILGRTGLHFAVIGNNIKAVKLLIKEKININKQDKNGQTAIYHAFRCNNLEMVKELLRSRDCDINLPDNTGTTMLHIACVNNDISMVRTLLRREKCAINAQDKQGRTPLHLALSSKYIDIVTLLVKTTDLNTKDIKGQTPLHISCETQLIEAVKLILKSGCDVNVQDNSGKTALHIAAEGWESSIVYELFRVNCNVHLCDNNGKTALFYARANRNKDIVIQFKGNSGNGRE
ncbi:unnamed protein product [Mytilus coruscus]|uniref:Uncharacterized protein n=1 Tax=Mytilus coruscus TaxID=42192 RepID=A0A6J8EPJ8_MYTCO|nr:unnamed protein product [Mytilus coruscus]